MISQAHTHTNTKDMDKCIPIVCGANTPTRERWGVGGHVDDVPHARVCSSLCERASNARGVRESVCTRTQGGNARYMCVRERDDV